jgi:nicotinamide-nucleotide amidase
MHAEVITTGTELLLGETIDTNSAYIARALRDIGLDLYYLITVGDNEMRMAEMLDQALDRSDVVITTGGLGPTVDDVTRQAVARATGRELVLMPELLADIEAFFTQLGRQMTDNNRRQAFIPAGATPIRNPVGTAPCFIVEDPRGIVISLPGVPREMEFLMQTEVLPYLSQKLGTQVIRARIIRTCAIGESTIDSLIGDLEEMSNPTVGLAAHPGQTDVRITAKGQTEQEVYELIARTEAQIRERLGDVIFGVDNETLEDVVARGLIESDQSVAIVESHTHGAIAGQLRQALDARREAGRIVMTKTLPPFALPLDETAIREQALEAARSSGAHLVLFVAGAIREDRGAHGADPGQTHIVLITRTQQASHTFRFGGPLGHTQQWVSYRALDMLRRALLGLPLSTH